MKNFKPKFKLFTKSLTPTGGLSVFNDHKLITEKGMKLRFSLMKYEYEGERVTFDIAVYREAQTREEKGAMIHFIKETSLEDMNKELLLKFNLKIDL